MKMVVSGNEQQDCVVGKENRRTKCGKSGGGLLFPRRKQRTEEKTSQQHKMISRMAKLAAKGKQCPFSFLLLLTLTTCVPVVSPKILDHHEVVADQVQAVLGNIAELPCDLNVASGDKIRLVLWSRDTSTVIYSLDAREKQIEEAQHWSNEQALGGRAYFRSSADPPSLIIENVKESDGGLYKCRLDYKRSPTLYHNVNLTIIIPPKQVVVVDERGTEMNSMIIGPYNEGSSLRLTCVSTGGSPLPKVSWWRENALLDDTWEVSSEHVTSTVVSNTLTISRLQRSDLNARLTCQAANSNISVPVSTTVTLDLSFRPLNVKILDGKPALSAEKEYTLDCQSTGARPPSVITWLKGSTRLKHHKETTSSDGNVTTSRLTFIPTMEDMGKTLICQAENPQIPGSTIEDGFKMDIHYVPQVTLELGSTLNSSFLRENADVYFECNIKATPFVQRVTWRQNARLLHHNASAGVIISNQSLVLQSITRKSAGLYTCIGTNKEGDGTSNAVSLNVKYAPVCKVHQQTIYGIARQEQAKILCEVDANPDTDLHFRWKFNNSAESIDIQQSHFTIERLRSTLTYKPMTELDYGTVLCWASHESVGAQKVPCVYHIIPAGKPDAVSNCSILNTTFDSLFVSCVEGFNGGLQQFFVIEIWDRESRQVLRNLTNPRPVFHVRTLEPGSTYVIRIYAANNKGRSETQVLQASTLKAAEKHTSINAEASSIKPAFGFKMIPVLAVIAAIIATIIIVAVVIVLVIRSKGHGGEDKRLPKNNAGGFKSNPDHDNSAVPLKKSMDDILDPDDKNPDVVPHGSEIDGMDPDEKVFLERLNNSSRFYETIPRAVRTVAANRPDANSSSELVNNVKNRVPRTGREEVTYAELSLPSSPAYHTHGAPLRQHPMSQEPIIYAQIDPLLTAQCIPVGVHEQQTQTLPNYPVSHPHSSSEQEEYVRCNIRPENTHAVYSNGSNNMRF
ncbi:uncharacterized protein LOC110843474 isoform X2 [Folsomia candida]|uniref:uncharacterized protein LOC110843474 isoform X2 n=1 Tax=Folsomia candida TaxID=158441 RepID=UPI0016053D54|nr:uncharacterized protein LOC110843474 isoform X2 [Folsomia candida]